jgi:hypothetical protein
MNTPLREQMEYLTKELLIQFQADPMLSAGAKDLAKDFSEEILSLVASKMPEKKDTDYMNVPYGVNSGKDCVQAQKNGWNDAIDSVKSILKGGKV